VLRTARLGAPASRRRVRLGMPTTCPRAGGALAGETPALPGELDAALECPRSGRFWIAIKPARMQNQRMCFNRSTCIGLLAFCCALGAALPGNASGAEPLRALLITGGCCHDYDAQKKILTEGISARANVTWTIVHEGGDTREHLVSIYQKAGLGEGL